MMAFTVTGRVAVFGRLSAGVCDCARSDPPWVAPKGEAPVYIEKQRVLVYVFVFVNF